MGHSKAGNPIAGKKAVLNSVLPVPRTIRRREEGEKTHLPSKTLVLSLPRALSLSLTETLIAMVEAEGDDQNLEPQHEPLPLLKRKPVSDCVEEGEEEEERRKTKLPKPDITAPIQDDTEDDDEDGEDGDYEEGSDDEEEATDPNGNAATDKGKGVVATVDKGKGKMLVEEEDDEDSDDSSDGMGDEGDDDSDFADDPLAEVDLLNILPSRTRQRATTHQGIRFVADRDGGDNDD